MPSAISHVPHSRTPHTATLARSNRVDGQWIIYRFIMPNVVQDVSLRLAALKATSNK
jgi:hypothetical protein